MLVNITYDTTVINTGIEHDLIIGCSIFDTSGGWVADLPWWIWFNVPTGVLHQVIVSVSNVSVPSGGNYWAKVRAWKTYDLTGATELADIIFGGVLVGRLFSGGYLYDSYVGDGVPLDQMDKMFTIPSGLVSADITNLQLSV